MNNVDCNADLLSQSISFFVKMKRILSNKRIALLVFVLSALASASLYLYYQSRQQQLNNDASKIQKELEFELKANRQTKDAYEKMQRMESELISKSEKEAVRQEVFDAGLTPASTVGSKENADIPKVNVFSDKDYSNACELSIANTLKDPESLRTQSFSVKRMQGFAFSGSRKSYDTAASLFYTATNSYGGRIRGAGVCYFYGKDLVERLNG